MSDFFLPKWMGLKCLNCEACPAHFAHCIIVEDVVLCFLVDCYICVLSPSYSTSLSQTLLISLALFRSLYLSLSLFLSLSHLFEVQTILHAVVCFFVTCGIRKIT